MPRWGAAWPSFPAASASASPSPIAHRLSTIAVLDRLIVMDEGRIVDDDERSPTLGRGQVRWASPGLPQRHYRSLNARERTFIDPMQAL
jgi:hypothetical protein